MEDLRILNEERKVYYIGPEKKRFELKMLGLSGYYEEFIPEFLSFLDYFAQDAEDLSLPTGKAWGKKKALTTLSGQLRRILSYKLIRKRFIKILKKVGYLKFSKKYFYKHVTPSMLADMFLRVYKFNVDDFKKKLSEVAAAILESGQPSQTFTDLLSSGAGSSQFKGAPGFREELKPRYRNLEKSKSHSSKSN